MRITTTKIHIKYQLKKFKTISETRPNTSEIQPTLQWVQWPLAHSSRPLQKKIDFLLQNANATGTNFCCCCCVSRLRDMRGGKGEANVKALQNFLQKNLLQKIKFYDDEG